MKWIQIFVILLVGSFAAIEFDVDEGSINKQEYVWTMNLRRNVGGEPEATNEPIRTAKVTIESLDKTVLHVKMVDADKQRWEAPLLNPNAGKRYSKAPMNSMGFEYVSRPFSFKVKSSDGKEMLDTNMDNFRYADKLLELSIKYFSYNIMGIGERVVDKLFLCQNRGDCSYTLWGKDVACPFDDGSGGCRGDYGQQPFYMVQMPQSKKFIGFFSFNSNDQDILLKKHDNNVMNVTHKMVGGIFDLYIFYPGSAIEVIKQYQELVGRPYLIPRWSMGYHQCRYGWRTLSKVKDVVSKFEQNDLPLDVVWADIDYMKDYADFTVDNDRFGGLKEFVQDLHKREMRWVPIVDAGIKKANDDKYYVLGEEKGAFIKSAKTKQTLVGRVWPGAAVFISWYHPYGPELWKLGLSDFYNLVEYDGIWLDMNEIANFCRGECMSEESTTMLRRTLTDDNHDPSEFDNLPYRPGWCDLDDKTISMTGYHHSTNDFEDKTRKEYNTHIIWSLLEAKATHEFLVEHHKTRPFVLTRANFPGMGLYSTKWLGDNFSRWEYMRYSIVGVYNYQMFGISMTGADMCGFMDNPQEELCARWMQLGAFYPFTRNHNDIHSGDKEPYVFGERVITATKNAMRQKYSIMMYYYTKIFETSLDGGSVYHPLFFVFPDDSGVYENGRTESMFMIGTSLMVVPALYPNTQRVKAYLPNENWYNLKDYQQVGFYEPGAVQGKEIELEADYKYVNLLLKGGSVIPHQDTDTVRRIETLKTLPMDLTIAPDNSGNAEGTLVLDDGISLKTIEDEKYSYLKFKFSKNSKTLEVEKLKKYAGENTKPEFVSKIRLFGVNDWQGMNSLCVYAEGKNARMQGFYDGQKKMMIFDNPSDTTIQWKDVNKVEFGASC
jgi:alpha-glucosidase (family GH31 glycosyl hydrolase)